MTSKRYIFLVVFVILLIIGGVFYWQQSERGEEEEISPPVSDFEIIDTPEGKFVVNEKEGLRVEVPNRWNVDKAEIISSYYWGVNLSSPDFVFDVNYNLEKGCMIEVNIEESNLNFELTNKRIQELDEKNKPTLEQQGYEIIDIDQKQAVKELVYDNDEIGMEINLRIPTQKDKNIYFVLRSSSDNKETCLQELDRFLETVEIK